MATKVVVCPECSQLVAYGRLSCPSCGAMLASVEGAERAERPTVVPGIVEPPKLIPEIQATADAAATPVTGKPRVAAPTAGRAAATPAKPATRNGGGFRTPEEILGIPPAKASKPPRPGQASLFADLPFDAPASLGGWLIALGSGLGVVGFLLPWADRMNLALPASGYFGSWGLAGPGHGFALVAALITFALAILPTPVPAWVRETTLTPIVAGILLGLAWPYLLGVVQPQIGVFVTTLAAVLMAAGIVVAQRPLRRPQRSRHDSPPPSV